MTDPTASPAARPNLRERVIELALREIRIYSPLPCSPTDAARIAAGEEPTGPAGLSYLAHQLNLMATLTTTALDPTNTNVRVDELFALNEARGEEGIVAIAQIYVRETHLLAELSRMGDEVDRMEGNTPVDLISVNSSFRRLLVDVVGLSPRSADPKLKVFEDKLGALLRAGFPHAS